MVNLGNMASGGNSLAQKYVNSHTNKQTKGRGNSFSATLSCLCAVTHIPYGSKAPNCNFHTLRGKERIQWRGVGRERKNREGGCGGDEAQGLSRVEHAGTSVQPGNTTRLLTTKYQLKKRWEKTGAHQLPW